MDALSEILKSIKMRYTAVGTLRLSHPWGLNFKIEGIPTAIGVIEGEPCWLRLPGHARIRLGVGDMALVRGAYQLLCEPDARPQDMVSAWIAQGLPAFSADREPEGPVYFRWGGGGVETRLLGLSFGLANGQLNPLIMSLPPCIVLRGDSNRLPWMRPAIEFLLSENTGQGGYTATARLLAELIFVSMVRSHLLSESKGGRGWLRGLADPRIAKALVAIHREPGAEWTVGSLAGEAGMSRTSFAARFAELVEATPIDYLTQWRMHLAAERIGESRSNLKQLAFELGYASDAAFRGAFKRHHGVAPSRYFHAPDSLDAEPSCRRAS
ncbi:Transcriptional regulator containing an amidase domain and an AraC-type DNA-binding HTH domain [Pseudomonas sp. JV551A1]|uniref:Transcriptional regulator containing an amidase domain and an AraC-type DNA-binding HTH domain n=1 Tax=Pseudomonas inefficax TaxID=2078786 RepID=A0AAQ1P938_9PSED|nr:MULTISPECIES: AraC family transcriptional regulator [Pseudomonas]SPO54609.1 Transcriptional regulator containing an amidase domain and an AraC-type DNA-binding HTH domain [Pseudomonas sp. JV551A1]SPO62110.1 Transcriptional regulator containing an amidase domain and an AraC-type DNA-binding HTH domain [Pseudomonas inefficax]